MPPDTAAVPNETISSSDFNAITGDIVTDLNAARPLTAGGTGATSASTARTALDVAQKAASADDFATGKGLIVGSGGLLGNAVAPGVTNADDLVTGDRWRITSSSGWSNLPVLSPGILLVKRREADRYVQQYLVTTTNRAFQRAYSDTWSAWSEVAMSQYSTGANGQAWLYTDGTLVCTSVITVNIAIGSAFEGGYRSSGTVWTYPVAFASSPMVQATPGDGAFGTRILGTPGLTTTQFSFTAVASQSTADRTVHIQARGRV